MQNLYIVYAGGFKEKYFSEAAREYEKRLKAFFNVENKEIKEAFIPESPSDSQISKALDCEGVNMLKAVPSDRVFKIAMCIEGKGVSSVQLSEMIEKTSVEGYSSVAFFIGSSHGLSEAVKSACNIRISMSEMTFPHQLARIMLLEQIYRAKKISVGAKYHK